MHIVMNHFVSCFARSLPWQSHLFWNVQPRKSLLMFKSFRAIDFSTTKLSIEKVIPI